MTSYAVSAIVLFCMMMTGCQPSSKVDKDQFSGLKKNEEAISFLGDTLLRPDIDSPDLHKMDSLLTDAFTLYEEDSTNLNAIIWYGRWLAYHHRYKEAIAVYTAGIHHHPLAAELYRHRGHRFITTRLLAEAIADLSRAATLASPRPVEIESDGMPNKLDIPLSNLHFNIYYHLGLAQFLAADYSSAIATYQTALTYSDNPDLLVAATNWLYLSYLRNGDVDKARTLLSTIHANMEIIENDAYLRQLLIYKGEIIPESDLTLPIDSASYPTLHYGVSCWHDAYDRPAEAASIRYLILSSSSWPAFGYIAAEADSSRLIVH